MDPVPTDAATNTATPVEWIAVPPPVSRPTRVTVHNTSSSSPPSFQESQYDVVLRHQRRRASAGPPLLKLSEAVPSRFTNLSDDFEFSGWGSTTHLKLETADHDKGENTLSSLRDQQVLGQFLASALAGNAVLGSVFYALPAVVAVSGIYSPISLFIATLTLFLWRPIMEELASALPISGAPYTYLINVSSKTLALVGAVLLLLDFTSTSVVSAATASSYLEGEIDLPFPEYVFTALVLLAFTFVSLSGIKESARFALGVLIFHIITMITLAVASINHWAQVGNSQFIENWNDGDSHSLGTIARHIFNGFCIGMLGLTGFECAPSYVARIKPGRFPMVLRNLHYPAILLNCLMMVFLLALVPLPVILKGANVLSVLAESAGNRWLRIWVVVDAVIVLCGGVLTGILSACELLERLALDRVIPQVFLHKLAYFNSSWVSVLSFMAFCGVLYSSTSASLPIMSKMFSLVWLTVMTLFPLALILLKFNRGRLPRDSRTHLLVIFAAFAIAITVFAGNIVVDPITVVYFAAYFFGILLLFSLTQNKIYVVRWFYWIFDQAKVLHQMRFTKSWGVHLVEAMRRLRTQPICVLAKSDEINHLMQMILYVTQNEETSCVKIAHFYDAEEGIPSEMEANAKILDEAFPEVTIDLILVEGPFDPRNIASLAHRLHIPRSLMFMTCPSVNFPHPVADFGTRIISL